MPPPVGPPRGDSRAGDGGSVRRPVVDADCGVATDGPEGVDCPCLCEGWRGGAVREGRLAVGGCIASPESSPSTTASKPLSRFEPVAGSLAGLSSGKHFWNFLGSALSLSSPENPEKGSSIRKSAVVTGYFTHGSHASVHKQSQKKRPVSAQN